MTFQISSLGIPHTAIDSMASPQAATKTVKRNKIDESSPQVSPAGKVARIPLSPIKENTPSPPPAPKEVRWQNKSRYAGENTTPVQPIAKRTLFASPKMAPQTIEVAAKVSKLPVFTELPPIPSEVSEEVLAELVQLRGVVIAASNNRFASLVIERICSLVLLSPDNAYYHYKKNSEETVDCEQGSAKFSYPSSFFFTKKLDQAYACIPTNAKIARGGFSEITSAVLFSFSRGKNHGWRVIDIMEAVKHITRVAEEQKNALLQGIPPDQEIHEATLSVAGFPYVNTPFFEGVYKGKRGAQIAQFSLRFKGDLHAYLTSLGQKRAPHNAVSKVALQLGLAILSIHAKNVVHRDLKTTNILVREWDESGYLEGVCLTDFGLCRFQNDPKFAQTCAGTFDFFAPEIAAKTRLLNSRDLFVNGVSLSTMVSSQVDIWGYGLILQRMLNGTDLVYSNLLGMIRCGTKIMNDPKSTSVEKENARKEVALGRYKWRALIQKELAKESSKPQVIETASTIHEFSLACLRINPGNRPLRHHLHEFVTNLMRVPT